jgi:hypothetical protein
MEPLSGHQTTMSPTHGWIQWVHVAGSVASITGISLLTLNRGVGSIALGEIAGWLISGALLLAVLTVIILFARAGTSRSGGTFGSAGLLVFWLTTVPVSAILMIFLFQLARELVVPFVVLLVHGQYPLP